MTLKLNRELDILKMYLQTKNEVARGQAIQNIWPELKKNTKIAQGQRSRSNVTKVEVSE